MTQPIISVRNIGKKYRLGATHEGGAVRYKALRDIIGNVPKHIAQRIKGRLPSAVSGQSSLNNPRKSKEFWALKDTSFDVQQGEVLGIIGRNGAGKTTLLKILSQITEPTEGEIRIRGRVASLLEVGTGFHPELTGRENIFMNGAILGMTKAEIKTKFDEIVAFAEVEKFIGTPVKRYSSGMYVRLAFAVAAHLEPEILLVDEVLAVGDAQFQEKSLGKMAEVSREGRTVLFVSHNMSAIQNLCKSCILIDNGHLIERGPPKSIVSKYLKLSSSKLMDSSSFKGLKGNDISITGFHLEDSKGNFITQALGGEPCRIFIRFKCQPGVILKKVQIHLFVRDMYNNLLFNLNNRLTSQLFETVTGEGFFICDVPCMPLAPGKYRLGAGISKGIIHEWLIKPELIGEIMMAAGDFFGTGWAGSSAPVLVSHSWESKIA